VSAWLGRSLRAKLLASQLLVVIAGAGTVLLIALLLGPAIFHRHIRDALGYVPPDVGRHLDMAFHTATLVSLAIGVGAAVAAAIALSAALSARIARPVKALAGSAQQIARGSSPAPVPARGADELAQLAEAFNEMARALEHAEQVRRRLLADVAHELRNPLATVESYVEGMADGVLAADQENWSAIRAETARLHRLVEDLQKVSLAEAHQLDLHQSLTPPDELLHDAVRAAGPAYHAKGVALQTDIAPRLPAIEVDRQRLAEALANLLDNALRHTPPSNGVRVSASSDGAHVALSVTDSGEGIPPEHLEQIFERFYRVDPARARTSGGTGIGLAIVRAIAHAHGGTVSATSEGPGRGATFTLRLPAARPIVEHSQDPPLHA
jgi:signal transduction histidine kinase